MSLTLYQLLLGQLPEAPDLSIVQERQPISEAWPLMLKSIHSFRRQLEYFTVSDGTSTAICIARVPEVYQKITAMEEGAIVHLMGAETVFSDEHKGYVLDVHHVMTLKEYDDHAKVLDQQQAEHQARLKAEYDLDDFAEAPHHAAGDDE